MAPCYYAHVRGEFRKKYNLRGSHFNDCCMVSGWVQPEAEGFALQ